MNKYILFGKDRDDKNWYNSSVVSANTIQEAFYQFFIKNGADRGEAAQYFIFRPDTRLIWEVTYVAPQIFTGWRYSPS